jgi:uncharacterized alpha/beta hydrolase family protein
VNLSDDRFSSGFSSMGLWRPVDFLDTIGAGLFLLGEYDASKTPVLFVHGVSGSPANFSKIIPQLDTTKFQLWVFHYPSGLSLEIVSAYLLRALTELQTEHQFTNVYAVAHCMGGLMVRSFVLRHQETESTFDLGLIVTINSPLYGMEVLAAP